MKKKIITLFVFVVLFAAQTFAQATGKIAGTVTDKKTGEKLPGVNIMLKGTTIGAATNINGYYVIINIPAGSYDVVCKMVGYQTVIQKDVKVVSGLTTKLNFKIGAKEVNMQEITVEEYKNPPVQKDLTSKIQARTSEEIARLPKSTIEDLLTQEAGIVKNIRTQPVSELPAFGQFATVPSDGLHFRGGRENETLFLYDGVTVNDQLWGGFYIDQISELDISSLETHSGTFGPKYGEAMSGVVSISPHSQLALKPKFAVKAFTDKVLKNSSQNTYSGDIYFNSALPFYKKLGVIFSHRVYSTDGYIYGYIYPEYVNSEGRDKSGTPIKVPMQYLDTQFSEGRILWHPITSLHLTVGGFYGKSNRGVYNHYFKYNPYGTPRVRLNGNLLYAKANYVFNTKSFINVTAAKYHRGFSSKVYDDPSLYLITPQTGTAEFSVTGDLVRRPYY
jgi:hypothetical protein